jgi:tetratricopeptide (TPR) repeat protein
LQEAERVHGWARDLWHNLTAAYPAVPIYRQGQAANLHNLGGMLAATGRLEEARQAYQEALALRQRLAADFPAVTAYQQELAATRQELGLLLARRIMRAWIAR